MTSFDDLFKEIEDEARAESPDAVRDLQAKRIKYRDAFVTPKLRTSDPTATE